MTTFVEMQAAVYEETRRPDLVDLTRSAIVNATLRAHHFEFFPLDLAEVSSLTYTPDGSAISYDFPNITGLIPRLRAISHCYSLDAVSFKQVEQLEYRDPNDLYDEEGCLRKHMYTQLGATLRVFPSMATGRIRVCAYTNPDTADATYSSWIADAYKENLALMAAATVWRRTGNRELAASVQESDIKDFKTMLITSHLLPEVN